MIILLAFQGFNLTFMCLFHLTDDTVTLFLECLAEISHFYAMALLLLLHKIFEEHLLLIKLTRVTLVEFLLPGSPVWSARQLRYLILHLGYLYAGQLKLFFYFHRCKGT